MEADEKEDVTEDILMDTKGEVRLETDATILVTCWDDFLEMFEEMVYARERYGDNAYTLQMRGYEVFQDGSKRIPKGIHFQKVRIPKGLNAKGKWIPPKKRSWSKDNFTMKSDYVMEK